MIPIGFPTAVAASAPVVPRFLDTEASASQPFSTFLRNAQASPVHDPPERPARIPRPARITTAKPAPSPDPRSAKLGDPVVVLQAVPSQQQPPILVALSFLFASGADQSLDFNSGSGDVSGNAGRSPGTAPPQDGAALPQLASPATAVAFSMNLQKFGSPDQKTASLEQATTDNIQASQPSDSNANPAVGNGQSSPPDTGSHQSGPETGGRADQKLELASGGPTEIQPLPVSPAQGLASIPTFSGLVLQRAPVAATADARPVAAIETLDTPVPASARQIDLTVPNDAGHQVDIRISQRGDDVQVTVRTPDGDLAQSLRHNLPELSETLSRNGLREEALHTARSSSAGDGDRGDTSHNNDRQRSRQEPEDQNLPTYNGRPKSQRGGSFSEVIHEEKRSN